MGPSQEKMTVHTMNRQFHGMAKATSKFLGKLKRKKVVPSNNDLETNEVLESNEVADSNQTNAESHNEGDLEQPAVSALLAELRNAWTDVAVNEAVSRFVTARGASPPDPSILRKLVLGGSMMR